MCVQLRKPSLSFVHFEQSSKRPINRFKISSAAAYCIQREREREREWKRERERVSERDIARLHFSIYNIYRVFRIESFSMVLSLMIREAFIFI